MTQIDQEVNLTLQHDVRPLEERTRNLTVTSQGDRVDIVEAVESALTLKKSIEEKLHLTSNRIKADELRDAARDTEKKVYDPIDAFIKAAKAAVKLFDTNEAIRIDREKRESKEKQEREEREAQAKRDAEALAAKEAEDRRALEEFERLQKEKDDKQKLLDAATAAGNVKVAGIAAKEVAKIDGQIEQAEIKHEETIAKIEEKAEEVPVPALKITSAPPIAVKKLVWKARVTNFMKLAKSVSEGIVPFNVLDVKTSELNSFAKGYDGKSKIDGLEFYQESTGRL